MGAVLTPSKVPTSNKIKCTLSFEFWRKLKKQEWNTIGWYIIIIIMLMLYIVMHILPLIIAYVFVFNNCVGFYVPKYCCNEWNSTRIEKCPLLYCILL